MRILIVDDEFVSRNLLQQLLAPFGDCDIAVDGMEAVEAFKLSMVEAEPYGLICMDIMMPRMDGQQALQQIRQLEDESGMSEMDAVKVIMTTAVDDKRQVIDAFYKGSAVSYFVKPVDQEKLLAELRLLGLIASSCAGMN